MKDRKSDQPNGTATGWNLLERMLQEVNQQASDDRRNGQWENHTDHSNHVDTIDPDQGRLPR